MKRNNVAKKLGIASLCLATAISAFSGITSFATSNVALAEDTGTVAVKDMVTVLQGNQTTTTVAAETRSAVVTSTYKATKTVADASVLRISSDVAYEATFNQIFYGNTELEFGFPEVLADFTDADGNTPTTAWGDFKFRITDAADENNFFDVVYKKMNSYGSTLYVEWNGQTYQTVYYGAGASTYNYTTGGYNYNKIDARQSYCQVAPSLMGNSKCGRLSFLWDANDLLYVTVNNTRRANNSSLVAKFDGTYDANASNNGFTGKSAFGLPKMTFPNGYKISFSSYVDVEEANRKDATDVYFYQIKTNGAISSNLVNTAGAHYIGFSDTAFTKDYYMKAYDEMEANEGKALLGWKDAEGALHSTATALVSDDISAYTPVFLGFNKIPGASVRIDPSVSDNPEITDPSGLRFITGFNPDDYKALEGTNYIKSFGTLLAYKESLTEGIFDVVNYATQLAATENKKVTQQPNTKGTFEYEHQGVTYTAYSVALINLTVYSQSYAARGYIVVQYADGTEATFYTLYNADNDIRSIEQTAYNLMTIGAAEYNTYTDAQKAIVDTYAAPLETAE